MFLSLLPCVCSDFRFALWLRPEWWQTECRFKIKPVPFVGAAVTTGRIIFGAVGGDTRLDYTVIGEAVNLSAKLEKHTKKEEVRALCTEMAYQEAIAQNYQPPTERQKLTNRAVEGVTEPLDLMVIGTYLKYAAGPC